MKRFRPRNTILLLMLALAASFIYLTLPVVVLFGFFLATESMTNRLLMQFVYVIVRTLIINGIDLNSAKRRQRYQGSG